MDIIIRKVVPEDAYDYAICHIKCWHAAYKGIVPEELLTNMYAELEQRVERCEKALREPDGHVFYCVMHGDQMVGRLIVSNSRDDDKPAAGALGAIYLLEEYWGKGYGKQVMDFALNTLKDMGYEEVYLWVLEENARARRFYEKCGFMFDGTRKEIYIGKPLIEMRYVRRL